MGASKIKRLLTIIGPGILVAATGVGAGDLATGAITGERLGVAILWAVLVGAALKFLLNEGLARWQLATGETLLEGVCARYGLPVKIVFAATLIFWSFFVSSALMSACGVAAHAILPIVNPATDKIIYGLIHSALAVLLVELGGYRLFEKVMSGCIAVMFVTVVATVIALIATQDPDDPESLRLSQIGRGMVTPDIPEALDENKIDQGPAWTVALMGGVGGTLTVLCYGYWIREEGREGDESLRDCRIDLATGYSMTAVFGVSMVILGSRISLAGDAKGAQLIVLLADDLQSVLGQIGPYAKWAFLLGAWGAIASSLFGVWQSVPYLFADFWSIMRQSGDSRDAVDTKSRPYRIYLYLLATLPAVGLWFDFTAVQKYYAIVGAACMPLLAIALILLNSRAKWVGPSRKYSWFTTSILVLTVLFFLYYVYMEIVKRFG